MKKSLNKFFNSGIKGDKKPKTNHKIKSLVSDPNNKSVVVPTLNIPRPEPLNDKQILKRLNKEMMKSKVFKSVYFQKLPEKINRKGEPINIE